MISSDKQIIALGLGVAYAASPFSRVDAVALPHVAAETGDEKSPLDDTIARKLADKAGKAGPSSGAGHSDTSKGVKNPPSSSKAHKDPTTTPFFVASASCAGECISGNYSPDSHFLMNAIQPCDANSLRQQWDFLQHGTFTMMKSVGASADSTDDWCVGVVPQEGGGLGRMVDGIVDFADFGWDSFEEETKLQLQKRAMKPLIIGQPMLLEQDNIRLKEFDMTGGIGMIDFAGSPKMIVTFGDGWVDYDMCSSGAKLGLVPCGDPASQWYPTDGQIMSALCWSHGFTSLLTAEGCNELSLSTTTATDGATASITRAETFMVVDKEFIESIPPPAPTDAPTDAPTTPIPTSPVPTPTETYTDAPTTPQPTDESDQPSSAPSATVVQECGETFTNKKVALSEDLTCPDEGVGPGRYTCAIELVGPEAEIDCNENALSQEVSNQYWRGICLSNGATARNCKNVTNFWYGLSVSNDGEVVNSVFSDNFNGMHAEFTEDGSKFTITDTEARNNRNHGLDTEPKNGSKATVEVKGLVNLSSNAGTGFYNFLNANTRLDIVVTDASLNLNSNENGFFAYLEASTDLNVFVEEGGSFTSCLNTVSDIKQTIPLSSTGAGVRFLVDGDGEYTCDQSKVEGTFVVTPVCQACPLGFVGFLE